MNLGEIWGAGESAVPAMSNHEHAKMIFEEGVRAGKRSIMKEIERYFLDLGNHYSEHQIQTVILDCTREELDALVMDDPDHFAIDRLPEIFGSLQAHIRNRQKAQQLGINP